MNNNNCQFSLENKPKETLLKNKNHCTTRRLAASNSLTCLLNRQIDDRKCHEKQLVHDRLNVAENLYRKDLYAHYGCINAIEFSKNGEILISGGDDRRILLWDVNKALVGHGHPIVMKAEHTSNIFCLDYDSNELKIFSGGNDDQVIVHDLTTTDVLNFFRHEKPVYGISAHPSNNNIFASAGEDGRVLVYDTRGSCASADSFFCLAQYKNSFHSVAFNPTDPVVVATANSRDGINLWDMRKPLKSLIKYGSAGPSQSSMNVRFSSDGKTVLALRRRLPPILYSVNHSDPICQFDHPGYYNSCTMKTCSFAGYNDEYILSGSDDFNLYLWKIPKDPEVDWVDRAHVILKGHRSIVNQVRYNSRHCIIASSGVEKIIKIWSPFSIGENTTGGLKLTDNQETEQRKVYSHDEYMNLVINAGQFISHDYSQQSTAEDDRMMAFFDSLVQREIEGWNSDDISTSSQNGSEQEVNSASEDENDSDSEDSDVTNRLISLRARSQNESPPRPTGSPNRITRLIANCREKLMRLAHVANKNTAAKNGNLANGSNNKLQSESETNKTHKSKLKKNLTKNVKKSKMKLTENLEKSCDSNSEEEPVDGGQPSTSTGAMRCTPRYKSRSIISTSSDSSDDCSENYCVQNKRKFSKNQTDSDSSSKEPRKRLKTKNKNNSFRDLKSKSNKKQKVKSDTEEAEVLCEVPNLRTSVIKISSNNADASTPIKTNNHCASTTSDSGITSGMSTNEKCNDSRQGSTRAESSDREHTLKNGEFKKRIDFSKRGYRKRTFKHFSSSDSSD